jgi:hypothetical protein
MEITEPPKALNSETLELARKYAENKKKREETKKIIDDLKAEQDMIGDALTKKMEEIGMSNFKLPEIGTFYLATSFYPTVLDAEKMIDWLDKNGQTSIAPRTINRTAFKEFYQERVEKDLPLPPAELVDAHSETGVRLRGAK